MYDAMNVKQTMKEQIFSYLDPMSIAHDFLDSEWQVIEVTPRVR